MKSKVALVSEIRGTRAPRSSRTSPWSVLVNNNELCLNLVSTCEQLCSLGQVPQPLWALWFPHPQNGKNNRYPVKSLWELSQTRRCIKLVSWCAAQSRCSMNAGLSRVVLTVFKQELSSVSKRLSPPHPEKPTCSEPSGTLGHSHQEAQAPQDRAAAAREPRVPGRGEGNAGPSKGREQSPQGGVRGRHTVPCRLIPLSVSVPFYR